MPVPATIERRVYRAEFRDVPGSRGRQKWVTAIAYNVVDDYGSLWLPGVFTESLSARMPTLLYGHDWYNLDHVLGKGIDQRETPPEVGPAGQDVLVEFDDPEFVPMVRQILWQLTNKTLEDASVGFERQEWRGREKLTDDEKALGATEAMVKAGMDELSIVVRGAVPGAKVRSRRMAEVDLDAVCAIAKRKAAGELTDVEAQTALDLLAGPAEEGVKSPPAAEAPPDFAAEDAELDAALESIGRPRSRR